MGKVCCFIGYRNIEKTPKLREKLTNTICQLITEKGVKEFLFGSKSNFDDFCREAMRELREEYPHIKCVYVRMYYPELGELYIGQKNNGANAIIVQLLNDELFSFFQREDSLFSFCEVEKNKRGR